ncbi:type IV pilus assembly protein PilM [Patescibacteria group bacterium]
MNWNPFKKKANSFLGIDIGTSAIKVVELSRQNDRIKLENYGEISSQNFYEKPYRTMDKSTLLLSSHEIAKAISAIFEESKIKERKTNLSIPDFSSFFIDFSLPPMSAEEVPEAIRYEARRYIPMPLSEVALDWSVIDGKIGNKEKGTPLKILLAAVPIEVINQYQEIASLSGTKLNVIEAEAFGLLRSLVGQDKETIGLIDIGAQSTTINIVDKASLKKSHSFDISGNELTQVISKSFNTSYEDAELLKSIKGLDPRGPVRKILVPLTDYIIAETEKIFQNFYRTEKKKVKKIILTGGSAKIPGLSEYFSENLKIETKIGNPFANIFYPPILEENFKEMGPSYAVAIGMAKRGLE